MNSNSNNSKNAGRKERAALTQCNHRAPSPSPLFKKPLQPKEEDPDEEKEENSNVAASDEEPQPNAIDTADDSSSHDYDDDFDAAVKKHKDLLKKYGALKGQISSTVSRSLSQQSSAK
jgi:hypothetical protein